MDDAKERSPSEERKWQDALTSLSSVLERDVSASVGKLRLSAAIAGPLRHAPFFDELARLFDLGRDSIFGMFERASRDSEWEPGPHPSIGLFHFQGGPAIAPADSGLVRMPTHFEWPKHRHVGVERVLILEGGYTDDAGRVYRPGDLHEMRPGTEHAFTVGDTSLLLALVLKGTIEML